MNHPANSPAEYVLPFSMDYTVEEINLICIYDTSDRYILIAEIEEAISYVDDPEILSLMKKVLEKLYVTPDLYFSELPLFPAEEEDENFERSTL